MTLWISLLFWILSVIALGDFLKRILLFVYRLQREELQDSQLLDLLSSIGSCSRLERLVIYQEAWSAQSNSLSNRLPKVIVRLVRQQLPRLTAFCLVYPLHSNVVEVTAGRLDREVKTTRPAFWFHLADELPRGTDSRVPRIHYDQIVDPDYSADFLNISLSWKRIATIQLNIVTISLLLNLSLLL